MSSRIDQPVRIFEVFEIVPKQLRHYKACHDTLSSMQLQVTHCDQCRTCNAHILSSFYSKLHRLYRQLLKVRQ